MKVKIIVDGFVDEDKKDTLEARMVLERLSNLECEFERNGISTTVWYK